MEFPQLPPYIAQPLTEAWASARVALGPVGDYLQKKAKAAASARSLSSVGHTFRHLCVIGLNRTELLLAGESEGIFGESWQELVDDSFKRGLALVFFAPRGYDGQPVNPYLFLAGEQIGLATDELDTGTLALAQQVVGNVPLLDLCRMSPAMPNTVNILVAADTLFHWDIKDNYVLPTTPSNWARDVEAVLREYPRTSRAHIYTQWDKDVLPPSERITVHGLRDLPLDPETWVNRPTVQEAYGNHLLFGGLMLAALVGGLLYWRQQGIDDLGEQLRVIEQEIPHQGRYGDLERAVKEEEQMMQRRELFFLTVKDTARALQTSNFKAADVEVRVPDVTVVPKQYLVTVEAQKDAYNGWLQEEPIAKDFLASSALLAGVRKPPATTFKLEGLVNLDDAWAQYRALAGKMNKSLNTAHAVSATMINAKVDDDGHKKGGGATVKGDNDVDESDDQ